MSSPPVFSRAAAKLEHALDRFGLDVANRSCADFGCNVGGFTGVLLSRGAARVHAVDTGYGALAWALRTDPRVVAMERTNALHADPPPGGVDLVAIDLGWTPQRLAVPAALRWLVAGGDIVTLIKPHYEASSAGAPPRRGGLPAAEAEAILEQTLTAIATVGAVVEGWCESPLSGAKSSRRGAGNREFLAHLRRAPRAS
ncbi:MAG TPA: SAM-dependent methyltransferase [Phycisphaerales bacterium]|nr:SAM-dependent methyltransferase [Phycisphaerales bacterium]HMP37911.1 SAM-dependent methyltransferase [Phycisphaerales bacterium]